MTGNLAQQTELKELGCFTDTRCEYWRDLPLHFPVPLTSPHPAVKSISSPDTDLLYYVSYLSPSPVGTNTHYLNTNKEYAARYKNSR